jgi:tyrosine ammonia-lyase
MTTETWTDVVMVPGRLDCAALEQAAGPLSVVVDPAARERVAACEAFALTSIVDGRPVYGATTGFGPMVGYAGREDPVDQCGGLLDHLSVGQGPDLPLGVVRATMLVRLSSLSHGRSGVSPRVLDALAAALATTFTPAVPTLGSLGASGDLCPLAHLTRALQGQGHAYVDGLRQPAGAALRRTNLVPLELTGRDALALVNGTSLTVAAAGLALAKLRRAWVTAVNLSALMVDLLGASAEFADPRLLEALGHPGAVVAGKALRGQLAGLRPSGTRGLQEPYSIRCTPQLLGAADTSIAHAGSVIVDDLNGVSDNPLFFPDQELVVHGGNFFGQPVANASDLMSMVAVQLGNLAERQLDLLVDPHRNGGLPPMLSVEPGRQHGVQGVQLAATSILTNMRRQAMPASIQSLPTNGHNQDIVPLGTQAALAALEQAESLRWLHGSLAVALRQAGHLSSRQPTPRRPTAPACAGLLDRLAEVVTPIDPDRGLHEDVRAAADLLDRLADRNGAGER